MQVPTSGDGIIHGVLQWPDPYLMARKVPSSGRTSSLFMPELHSSTPGRTSQAESSLYAENGPAVTSPVVRSYAEMSSESAPLNKYVAPPEDVAEIMQFKKVSAQPSRQVCFFSSLISLSLSVALSLARSRSLSLSLSVYLWSLSSILCRKKNLHTSARI